MELRGLGGHATPGRVDRRRCCGPGDVIGLDGDLGAGKTTFVRFLARALGVTTPVTSPTFTLANTYEAPQWPSAEPLPPPACSTPSATEPPAAPPAARTPLLIHHIDAYRLEGDADAEDLALAELLDSGGIVVVEWAERLTSARRPPGPPLRLPPRATTRRNRHTIPPIAPDHRIATITPHGPTVGRPTPRYRSGAGAYEIGMGILTGVRAWS